MSGVEPIAVILVVGLLTYGTRIAGFALVGRRLPAAGERFLRFVPIAAFAALAVPGVVGGGGEGLGARVVAALAAAAVTLRFGRLWACLVVGMGTYWLVGWWAG